jgi:ribonuclease G
MAKEICISSTPHETRLAILEDDQLAEIYYERENEYTLAGSIYNGRVTRVLPGMQSAFVDLGLERDAFLYVTDFLEMEDPEESDEVEKAAVAGGAQAPREINRITPEKAARPEGRRERGDQDRGSRDRKPAPEQTIEIQPIESTAHAAPSADGLAEGEGDAGSEQGGKRWRGRRRRRGGRGGTSPVSDPVETEASADTFLEPAARTEPAVATELQASSYEPHPSRETSAPPARGARPERAAAPFLLPGESLSKYGGEPAATSATSAPQPVGPARPAVTFKPSTLIESPLEWDGSGLLPGESISRHRNRPAEPIQTEPTETESNPDEGPASQLVIEPDDTFADLAPHHSAHTVIEETEESDLEFVPHSQDVMESTYLTPESGSVQGEEFLEEELTFDEEMEEVSAHATELAQPVAESDPFSDPFFTGSRHGIDTHDGPAHESHEGHGQEAGHDAHTGHSHDEHENPEGDRTASHHVDPLPPSEFRLFGLGGKKKKTDEPTAPEPPTLAGVAVAEPVGVTTAPAARSVSGFAPGTGLVEEETIEGEEFDLPRSHHKSDEHDLDDYEEEEKLQTQIRSGALGEMFQEAHLDHRIQVNFGDKTGDAAVDDEFDIDEDEEEGTEEQTTADGAAPAGQPRRDRGGRGRRGARPGRSWW